VHEGIKSVLVSNCTMRRGVPSGRAVLASDPSRGALEARPVDPAAISMHTATGFRSRLAPDDSQADKGNLSAPLVTGQCPAGAWRDVAERFAPVASRADEAALPSTLACIQDDEASQTSGKAGTGIEQEGATNPARSRIRSRRRRPRGGEAERAHGEGTSAVRSASHEMQLVNVALASSLELGSAPRADAGPERGPKEEAAGTGLETGRAGGEEGPDPAQRGLREAAAGAGGGEWVKKRELDLVARESRERERERKRLSAAGELGVGGGEAGKTDGHSAQALTIDTGDEGAGGVSGWPAAARVRPGIPTSNAPASAATSPAMHSRMSPGAARGEASLDVMRDAGAGAGLSDLDAVLLRTPVQTPGTASKGSPPRSVTTARTAIQGLGAPTPGSAMRSPGSALRRSPGKGKEADGGGGKLAVSKFKDQLEQIDLMTVMNQAVASTRSPVKAISNPTGERITTTLLVLLTGARGWPWTEPAVRRGRRSSERAAAVG